MKTYDKLVRDRIPEIIEASGKTADVEVMEGEVFLRALLDKLVEEAREARDASPQERATELADLLEVIEAVMRAEGLSEPQVRAVQRERREARGGFERRLRLLSVRD
ncbi:nucleoside triphosphate pyrophosphohydrolase [Deinococcus pimensis]|uniref:nucleoside triphosphate pyrophosphohydrolase n=1 Tax=Deinococcus pimensis TaxID=309888 RepID=UPI0004874A86|nr:nucleoside triphosphate pyrophosphohydrolase [Deinococcus pimensis]